MKNHFKKLTICTYNNTKKQTEIGRVETNKHQIFIRFNCNPANEI